MVKKTRKHKSRNSSKESDAAGGLLVLLIIIGGIYWLFFRDKGPELPETVEQQLQQIDYTEQNLKNLLTFLEQQRESLRHQEEIVGKLRSEHELLKPLVEADRKVISAVLAQEAKIRRKNIWIDRFIVFMLGIASSFVANFVWLRIRRKETTVESNPNGA